MNSCIRHCSMEGRYYGDQRTIHYTRRSMLAGAPLRRSFKGARGLLPWKLEKSNSCERSHFCMEKDLPEGSAEVVPQALSTASASVPPKSSTETAANP